MDNFKVNGLICGGSIRSLSDCFEIKVIVNEHKAATIYTENNPEEMCVMYATAYVEKFPEIIQNTSDVVKHLIIAEHLLKKGIKFKFSAEFIHSKITSLITHYFGLYEENKYHNGTVAYKVNGGIICVKDIMLTFDFTPQAENTEDGVFAIFEINGHSLRGSPISVHRTYSSAKDALEKSLLLNPTRKYMLLKGIEAYEADLSIKQIPVNSFEDIVI